MAISLKLTKEEDTKQHLPLKISLALTFKRQKLIS
jgi:hypothetical protein